MNSASYCVCFELQIGRPAFDVFLKKYIARFKFQSIDTETFLEFLKENVPGIENQIDLKLWTEGTGIPPDAFEPVSTIYTKIVSLANEFKQGRMPRDDEVADWNGQEWELYLENLPKPSEASQVFIYFYSYLLPITACFIIELVYRLFIIMLHLCMYLFCLKLLGRVVSWEWSIHSCYPLRKVFVFYRLVVECPYSIQI